MSGLEGLSVAANVLQIVNFADTVFRTGKSLYELFSKFQSASTSIMSLVRELHALLQLFVSLRVLITEHASSPFSQIDGHTMQNVRTILTLIEHEFWRLKDLVSQVVGPSCEGWSAYLPIKVRWALKDPEIMESKQRLSHHTLNLNTALSICGRRNEIVMRAQMETIHQAVHTVLRIMPTQPPNLIQPSKNPKSALTFPIPKRLARASYIANPQQNKPQGVLIKAGSTSIIHTNQGSSTTTANSSITDGSHAPLFGCIYPVVSIYEQADRSLFLDTSNHILNQIMKPVMLLRENVAASFALMRTSRMASISKSQMNHLQLLLDFLVASAHTASAETIMEIYRNASRAIVSTPSHHSRKGGKTIEISVKDSRDIITGFLPVYLEEKILTLESKCGPVKLRISSGLSNTTKITLAFKLEYRASNSLHGPAFSVHYISHAANSFVRPIPRHINPPCFYLEDQYALLDLVNNQTYNSIKILYGQVKRLEIFERYTIKIYVTFSGRNTYITQTLTWKVFISDLRRLLL